MKTPFNINECVSVKLTKEGVARWYQFYEEYGIISEGPKIDPDGWTQFQMWGLMEMFGPVMGMAMPNMFETGILIHFHDAKVPCCSLLTARPHPVILQPQPPGLSCFCLRWLCKVSRGRNL